jgi:hypothetical protein
MSIMDLAYFRDWKSSNNPLPGEESHGEVCIANISLLERRKRLRFGIQVFLLALVVLGVLVALHSNPLWRLPLLLLFAASATGFFQARDKT